MLRHAHRDRGLAGAGMSGKAHVQGGAFGRQPNFLAQARHQQQGGHLPDVGLHGFQAHQFTIQFVQDLLEIGIPMSGADIHKVSSVPGRRLYHGGIGL